jgi:peroxiredoxin
MREFKMVLTYSQPLEQGMQAPDFTLLNAVSGEQCSLSSVRGESATVIMFICVHCPYVQHIEPEVVALAKEYQQKHVSFVAISANDVTSHPQDAPEFMQQRAKDFCYPFPYLYDETQAVAKAYHAECTPEFLVFDSALKCVYHGRFDAAAPGNTNPVTGNDLRQAIDATLAGEVLQDQKPSMGCNIKWKSSSSH